MRRKVKDQHNEMESGLLRMYTRMFSRNVMGGSISSRAVDYMGFKKGKALFHERSCFVVRLIHGVLWVPHFGSRKSKTLLTSVRSCAVVTGDSLFLWHRQLTKTVGGIIDSVSTQTKKTKGPLIRPSLPSNGFLLLLRREWGREKLG